MKLKTIIGTMILATMILFVGCAKDEANPQIEVGEGFLEEFYSFNKDGRYDEFEAVLEDRTITQENVVSVMDEAINQYYATMSEYSSEDAIKYITNNRLPMGVEESYKEDGKTLEVDSITLEVTEENKYNWIVTAKITDSNKEETIIEQKGQMIFNKDNKIESVYFENLKALVEKASC